MAHRGLRFKRWLSALVLVAVAATVTSLSAPVLAQPAEELARVGDLVWVDANVDGFQDTDEPGYGAMAIELWSVTPFGEPFEAVVTTTSDGLGRYELEAPPGNYRVRAILPDADAEFALTGIADEERNNDIAPQGDGTGLSEVITLEAGVVVTDLDIGIYWPNRPPSLASLESGVWHDVDRSGGTPSPFDRPIAGVGVQAQSQDGLVVAETLTDGRGVYELQVAPGTYRLIYSFPAGFMPPIDSELDAEYATPFIELEPGSFLASVGMGLIGPGANVFGEVFFDNDANGARDPVDGPASNIIVELFRDGQLLDTTLTEAGHYAFLGVDPVGSYQVQMSGRPDLVWSGPGLGADGRSAEFTFDASGVMRIDAGLAEPVEERVITFTSPRSLPEGTFALLTVDDVATQWDFSPVDVAAPLGQELIVIIELEPDGSWTLPTVTCTDGVSAQLRTSVSPPYAYWQVTRTGIEGPHSCSVDADYFFDEVADVVISVVAPPEYGDLPVALTWFPDVGGAFIGKVAVPGSPAVFRVPAVPGGAEWSLYEDSPLEPVVTCDIEAPVISSRSDFEFDPSGLDGQTVNCTITMVEPMPELATVTYTKVAAVDDTRFEVGPFGELAAGETATRELPLPIRLTEDLPAGFDLVDVVCSDGEWTETFTPRFPSSTFLVFTLDQATPGSTISCTSTSVVSPEDAELVISRVGPSGATAIDLDAPGSPTYVLDDSVTIRAEAGRVELVVEPPSGQRFVELVCDAVDVTRQPGTGLVTFTAPSGRTDCTLTTESSDDSPVEVHLRVVLPVDAPDLPDVSVLDPDTRVYIDADGAVFEHRLGTGNFDGVRFNTLASPPWELAAVSCTGDVTAALPEREPGSSRFPQTSVAFGASIGPGDRIDCDLELQRLPAVPLRIELVGAPDDIDIPVRFDEQPVGDISADAPLVLDLAIGRAGYATFEAGRVGYVTTSIDCDDPGATAGPAGPYGVFLLATVESLFPPDAIVCTLQVAPAGGAMLTVRTEVAGVEGNASMRFDVEHGLSRPGDISLASATLTQRDVRSFELIADQVRIRSSLPPSWESVSAECDGGVPELLDDGSMVVYLSRGRPTECVFTARLISPDELGVPGDANCDAIVDIIDALVIAQFEAQVRSGAAACPLADPVTELFSGAADFDGSGGIDILDALQVARCTVGLPAAPCADAFEVD